MKEKHLTKGITRKLLVPTLTLMLMVGSVVPSFATDLTEADLVSASQSGQTEIVYQLNTNQLYGANTETQKITNIQDFKDYKSSYWGNQYMESLFKAGGISGYPDQFFRPEGKVTYGELASMLIGSTGNDNEKGNWPTGIMEEASRLGIINSSEISKGKEAISREAMASMLVKSAEKLLKEDIASISTTDGAEYVADLSSVSSTNKDYVIKAYKMGLLEGKGNGVYSPSDNTTRAEACVIICKLTGLATRNTPSKLTPQSTTDKGQWQVVEDRFYETGKFAFEEGDLFNGKPLVRDPDTGVLGLDIGGNLYTGMPQPGIAPGHTFKPGHQAGFDMEAAGLEGAYIRDKRNNFTFFESEWTKFELLANKNLANHKGESGYFDIKGNPIPAGDTQTTPYYRWDSSISTWTWMGPMYNAVL